MLIDAATLTTIGLIGYSAMAGVVGGGLGDLTYFQSYNNGNGFLLYGDGFIDYFSAAESSAQLKIMEQVKKIAEEKYNLSITLVSFGDHNLPNRALNSGNIDANIFNIFLF